MTTVNFIDLFAGIGGMRLGFESACHELGLTPNCVFSSEVKKTAVLTYDKNFNSQVEGDITAINLNAIPNFDFLLAGFPCQAFSTAGKRQGFLDTRGTLFFEIEKILKHHQPQGFLLENVDNLVNHDQGKTLKTIENNLSLLGYQISWGVFDAKYFGVAQERKRLYITGLKQEKVSLTELHFLMNAQKEVRLKDILEKNQPTLTDEFAKTLTATFSPQELVGKAIKDKRGGKNNIHSWELCLKGNITTEQKAILNTLLKVRRYKKWAAIKGIKWMDGMPLTLEEIEMFYAENQTYLCPKNLKQNLDDLVEKGYLKLEHPKDEVAVEYQGKMIKKRVPREDLPKGYNIVTGKLSFPISKILDPNTVTPALVATDMAKLAVVDGEGIRKLTIREGLRLFGFPESYQIDLKQEKAYDLLGNTVVVPVIKSVSLRLLMTALEHLNNRKIQSSLPVCS